MLPDLISLNLGDPFHVDPLKNPRFMPWMSTRRLIYRESRLVGHWTTETPISVKGYLWLQNYAAYHAPEFYLRFDSVEIAINRAKEILSEWDDNGSCPTWCC